MTLRGRIQNGLVILDEPHDLPDGTEVDIAPIGVPPTSTRTSPVGLPADPASGPCWNPPEELDQLLAMLRREKQEELRDEHDREDPGRSVA